MILEEYDEQAHMKWIREDGIEEGIAIGREEARAEFEEARVEFEEARVQLEDMIKQLKEEIRELKNN